MAATIHESLDFILKSITKEPEKVTINTEEKEGIIFFEISAPQELIGQIIGKEGKIIKSIRTILNLSYPNIRFSLEIKD